MFYEAKRIQLHIIYDYSKHPENQLSQEISGIEPV